MEKRFQHFAFSPQEEEAFFEKAIENLPIKKAAVEIRSLEKSSGSIFRLVRSLEVSKIQSVIFTASFDGPILTTVSDGSES